MFGPPFSYKNLRLGKGVCFKKNVQHLLLTYFDVYIDALRFTFRIIFCLADAKIGWHGLNK